MSIKIFKISPIHKSMVVGVDSFLSSCGESLIKKCIDLSSRIELQSIENFGSFMSVGNSFSSQEIRIKSMCQEHDRESIIPYHCWGIIIGELSIFCKSKNFIKRCCIWEMSNRKIDIELGHKITFKKLLDLYPTFNVTIECAHNSIFFSYNCNDIFQERVRDGDHKDTKKSPLFFHSCSKINISYTRDILCHFSENMRYPIIDSLRWISVIWMILYHANYLLEHVFMWDIFPGNDIFWHFLGYSVAVIFISLAWIVSVLSTQHISLSQSFQKALARFTILAISALTVTVVTYFVIPEQRISWWILHFFALVSIVSLLTVRMRWYAFFIGIGVLSLPYLSLPMHDSILLIPIILSSWVYYSADYYPLIPWFWYYLIWQGIGWLFLSHKHTMISYANRDIPGGRYFGWIGRYALVIYMIHVPLLYGCIWGVVLFL